MTRAASLAVAAASIAALASRPSSREFLAKWSGISAPGGVWRMLAILLALVNLKNLPFVWHVRPPVSFPSRCLTSLERSMHTDTDGI